MQPRFTGVTRVMSVVALVACCGTGGAAQPSERAPAFEVATVNPSGHSSPTMSIQLLPGGRLVTSNTPLTMLVSWAFSLDEGRLFGVPPGADVRFDVVAPMPENSEGRV